MMAARKRTTPDFFAESSIDPVASASAIPKRSAGTTIRSSPAAGAGKTTGPAPKKKAGFYLSADILERFNLKFHELKLAGVAVDNKSTLLELAMVFALDDLDKGDQSRVMRMLRH
jgi:hypothetical protein